MGTAEDASWGFDAPIHLGRLHLDTRAHTHTQKHTHTWWMLTGSCCGEHNNNIRTSHCTFYGVEVRTREVSHNPLLLMGGAHVNLQGEAERDMT